MPPAAIPSDLVDRSWQSFRARAIPPDADEQQLYRARLIFFAGALAVYELLLTLGVDDVDDDDAGAALDSIGDELYDFRDDVYRGVS